MKKLTEEFNKATVAKGEVFAIELPSNSSTGYSWDMKLKAGKASLLSHSYTDESGPMMFGGGGKTTYIYKAEEAGSVEIDATYRQPWNGGDVGQSKSFSITVK